MRESCHIPRLFNFGPGGLGRDEIWGRGKEMPLSKDRELEDGGGCERNTKPTILYEMLYSRAVGSMQRVMRLAKNEENQGTSAALYKLIRSPGCSDHHHHRLRKGIEERTNREIR